VRIDLFDFELPWTYTFPSALVLRYSNNGNHRTDDTQRYLLEIKLHSDIQTMTVPQVYVPEKPRWLYPRGNQRRDSLQVVAVCS